MSEHEMLQKIINAGGSAEGPGWFVAYTYCMNSVNMLLFVPIAVAFAGGENTEAELHSRFFLFSYIRSGRKQYLVGKAAGLLVSGGLTAFLAMVFLLVICILRFTDSRLANPIHFADYRTLLWCFLTAGKNNTQRTYHNC
jgi:hypothetical protein